MKARLSLQPNPGREGRARSLKLDGEIAALRARRASMARSCRQALSGRPDNDLTILEASRPQPFTLEIETVCNPDANKR